MRERAAELGGTLTVAAGLPGGTVVTAVLPARSTAFTGRRIAMEPIRVLIADDHQQFP